MNYKGKWSEFKGIIRNYKASIREYKGVRIYEGIYKGREGEANCVKE